MDRSEYAKIKISYTPTEFIEEYNLHSVTQNRWVYFEIIGGCYDLPQGVKLSNDLLRTRLKNPAILKVQQTQDYGNTPGAQSNFSL